MKIKKEAPVSLAGTPTPEQLEAINRLAKTPLTAEQAYVFSLRLCDDQPDRDYERFDTGALPRLAELFVGKTGIADHQWSTQGQVARIFAAQTVTQGKTTYLQAWAYLLRCPETQGLIRDIEAGIKKEVSVGCAMGKALCSVCGEPYGTCGHKKGGVYGGKLCCAVLAEPQDAYEFSFVAVPAQREAGVLKALGAGGPEDLTTLAEKAGPWVRDRLQALEKRAELGDRYETELRQQVVTLGLTLEAPEELLRTIAKRLSGGELEQLRRVLEEKAASRYPLQTQLPGTRDASPKPVEAAYLI